MNTNWVEGVDEVSRIVRTGGEVWVAEVRSRFARKSRKPRGGKRIGDVKDDEHDDIISEEDQVQNKNDDTDLDPFVAVWRKRGFVMQGPPDLGNRMFVRLKFVKTPERTAEAPSRDESKSLHRDYGHGHGGGILSSTEEKQKETEEEGKVLKPCVYKTR